MYPFETLAKRVNLMSFTSHLIMNGLRALETLKKTLLFMKVLIQIN